MTTHPPHDELPAFLRRVILPPGWQVLHEATVASTNDLAKEAGRRGWPDRSVFVADYQTGGRGRQGRVWVAPPGASLLFSVLLRTASVAPHAYTMLASVAVCEAIERLVGLEPRIKWPNDVMLDHRKTAGILAEASDDGAHCTLVIGIGVNVNVDEATLAPLPNATSLSLAAGWSIHRGELLVLILEQLDMWLRQDPSRLMDRLWPAWEGRLWGRHQAVLVREGDAEIHGVILGAAPDGALRILTPDGAERRFIAGEILP